MACAKNSFPRLDPITILIVDDNAIYRNELSNLISRWKSFRVIATSPDASTALNLYRQQPADLVLMDVDMPGLSGPGATRKFLAEFPNACIIAMAVRNHDPQLLETIRAGACGYVLKDFPGQELQYLLLGYAADYTASISQ